MTKNDFEVVRIPCYKWKVRVFEGGDVFVASFPYGHLHELKDFLKDHKFPFVPGLFSVLITCQERISDWSFSITHDEIIYTIMGGVYND